MAFVLTLRDTDDLYKKSQIENIKKTDLRECLNVLGHNLAQQTKQVFEISKLKYDNVLCVVILRGGAFLFSGFLTHFPSSDFCMAGISRDSETGTPQCDYITAIESHRYDCVVYLDCVVASGSTILKAHEKLSSLCQFGDKVAAVICSSTDGTRKLTEAGFSVLGYSLSEHNENGVVAPDFGRMDAGEVFHKSRD